MTIFSNGSFSTQTLMAQQQPQSNLTSTEQQQSPSNFTSAERQLLTEGNSFEIDNVTFSHHTATVNGIQLHYVMGGKGDPVVLLHGYPQSWYEWRHIMPALAKNYMVIFHQTFEGLAILQGLLQDMMVILLQKIFTNLSLN